MSEFDCPSCGYNAPLLAKQNGYLETRRNLFASLLHRLYLEVRTGHTPCYHSDSLLEEIRGALQLKEK